MNNFEWIKNHSDKESLGRCLCDLVDVNVGDCEKCPVSEQCSPGNNGYIKWLEKEHK